MSSRPRDSALIFGLVLIVIGVIFFIENLDEHFSAWRVIARYWPLILIIIGLKRIHGYFTFQDSPPIQESPHKE